MKSFIVFLSGFVLFLSQSALADFKIPKYEKLTLDNGLTVYLMEQHEVPLIDVQMVVKAGASNDGLSYGLANLTSESLRFGSGDLSKKKLEDLLAFYGANLNTTSSLESSKISLSLAAKDSKKLLAIFRDIILKPKFSEQEYLKEKSRYIDQLKQSREHPRSIIGAVFNKMYYQKHPYGNPVIGDEKSVKNIDLESIRLFYQEYYVANNSALILVGDFNTKKMAKRVKKLFSAWNSSTLKSNTIAAVAPPKHSNVWLINKDDAIETTFMLGGKGIAANHPDQVAVQVINTILGARFTSWLNDELRVNSGLTYGARSRFNSHSKAGNFLISTFTKKETTFEALDLALKTYQRLWKKGIDKETLESAKAYVKGQFPPRYETSGQLANWLARMWSLNLDDSFINNFQTNVDSLDITKANKIAKAIFPKDNLQFVLIGKTSDIREGASKYGKVTEMDIKTFEY